MEAMLQRDIWKETPAVKSRIASYWDGRSDSFKIQRDAELHSEQHQLWQEELLSHLPEKKGLRILDVGCGCGFFSLMLAECGHQVTGIDESGIDSTIDQRVELVGKMKGEKSDSTAGCPSCGSSSICWGIRRISGF